MKEYLGDAVYVELDPIVKGAIILTTSDGYKNTNTIVLEDFVYEALIEWRKRNEHSGF